MYDNEIEEQLQRGERYIHLAIDRQSQFERQRRLNLRLMWVVMAETLTIAYLVWGRW